jgi:hypothetical protein
MHTHLYVRVAGAQDRALNAATQADNAFKAARGACSARISLNHRLYQHISQQLYSQRNPTTSLLATLQSYAFVHLGAAGVPQNSGLNAAAQLDNALKVGIAACSASHQPKPSPLPAIYLSNYTVSVTLIQQVCY